MQKLIPRFLLLLALLAAALAYRPGLHGPFLFDDGINIVSNPHLKLADFSKESLYEAAFSISNGLFGRPLSMLSFAVNFYFDRDKIEPFPSAFSFKTTNLAIHLLSGIAIFILTRLLVALFRERRRPDSSRAYPEWLALAVSAAWLLHPLNLTSVLYVVQRMASLAALFTFIGLILYVWGRARLHTGQRGGMMAILAGLLVFTPLALLSKENGVLLPVFMLATELILFRFETAQPGARRFLIGFFVIFAALPALIVTAQLALHPDWLLAGYARRDFTLTERLMTEARIVWFYLRLILLPSTALMGVVHDDIAVSRELFDQATTLPAIIGILALPVGVWLLRRRQPLVAFGILFFLVGHSLESTVYPLELAHEHRNYLPMFGILLAFFHLLLEPLHAASARWPRRAAAILLIALFAAGTFSRASDWSTLENLWSGEVEHHPASIRANTAMGDFYANALTFDPATKTANYEFARHYYEQIIALKKYNTDGLFSLVRLSELYGQPVDKAWLNDLAHGLEHEAIASNTNDRLITLAMCKTKVACPLRLDEIDELMRAPLRNPKVIGRDKALIYSALTVYLFNITHDYTAAAEATRHAIELDPQDIEHQLWLATILIAMQRPDEAREQISLLKQLDPKKIRARDIEFLEKQLTQGN